MSYKTTRTMTRREAEAMYVDWKLADAALRRTFRAEATLMDNAELENALERLHNATYDDGDGLENYLIRDDHE